MNNSLPVSKSFRCLRVVAVAAVCICLSSYSFANLDDFRKWRDASGKFEIEAKLSQIDGETIVLEKRDGKIVKVPYAKLSPLDKGFIEGRRSTMASDNPFKEVEAPAATPSLSTNSPPPASSSGGVKTIEVDFNDAPITSIDKGNWQPNIGEQPGLGFELKNIVLPGKPEFFEKMTHATANAVAKRAVFTHQFSRHGKPSYSRMVMVDLETGKVLANASGEGKWKALAVADDGQNVVVQNVSDSDDDKGQLGTVELRGKKIIPLELWKPYSKLDQPAKEKVVTFAKFINNNRLLTLSQNGRVVIWDFASKRPVRRFSYHGACQPSLTHDRKFLAICGGDLVGFVNLEDDSETPSVKEAPEMNYWLSSAFSPSCKRFAAATMRKLMVWDVATGEVLFEGGIPGLSTAGRVYFPDEEFVIINNDKLIEFSSGIKLWRYSGGFPLNIQGQMTYAHIDGNKGKLFNVDVPHPKALSLLNEAKSQSDLFVLKKGAKVGIDVSGVSPQYRNEVESSLKQQIEKMEFVFDAAAPVRLKATIKGPTTEAVSYHFSGSFVVRQFNSRLEIMYDGKAIWSAGANNVPGMVSGRGKAEIKKQLEKAGRSPNLGFFGSTHLPEFLQKPTGDGKNGDAQMLGASRLTLNGFE